MDTQEITEAIDRIWNFNVIFAAIMLLTIFIILNELKNLNNEIQDLQESNKKLENENKDLKIKNR